MVTAAKAAVPTVGDQAATLQLASTQQQHYLNYRQTASAKVHQYAVKNSWYIMYTSIRMVLWSTIPVFLVLSLHFWRTHWLPMKLVDLKLGLALRCASAGFV